MAKKALNKVNLTALGAETLAGLLLEVTKGNAALQRRVRLELSASEGPADVARDIRKRFASIRRATGFLSWRRQRTFAAELSDLVGLIEARVAPDAPGEAFDLLWSFLHLAPGIVERTDDSNGTIGDVMAQAMEAIGRLSPRIDADPVSLAETVFEVLQDNGYGAFDGAIPALAEALGPTGLERLKALAQEMEKVPMSDADLARYDFVDDDTRRGVLARESRDRTASMILQDVADLQGDVNAWMARYSAEQLTNHTIAPDVALRLLAAGRADEALAIVEASQARERSCTSWLGTPDLDLAYLACLEALGRRDDMKSFLWEAFCRTLAPDSLRRYLKLLPDFEDIEAEERARKIARTYPSVMAALAFFLTWPDLPAAARLIEARPDELDGDAYYTLTPAAEALEAEQPLAATLAWRAMITDTLGNARSKRYGYAARHLAQCALVDVAIEDYAGHPGHAAFVDGLREQHGRKQGFWGRVDGR